MTGDKQQSTRKRNNKKRPAKRLGIKKSPDGGGKTMEE